MNTWNFEGFEQTSRSVLKLLHQQLGFALWMITRVDGTHQVVLHAEDRAFGVKVGHTFRWSSSFCIHMVDGQNPCIAPRAQDIPAYARAAALNNVDIQAYIGQPIHGLNGELFGTLCAIDNVPHSDALHQHEHLLGFMVQLLSHSLHAELRWIEQQQRIEQLAAQAMTDGLTQVFNRSGWNHFLHLEEERGRLYGTFSAVFIVDLDGLKRINDTQGHAAGDALIQHTAHTLRQVARKNDVLARLGGDEFGLMMLDIDHESVGQLLRRIETMLKQAGIDASVGVALRAPGASLKKTTHQADQFMYLHKRLKKDRDPMP